MTDDPRAHLDDEALSAVLDGEGTDDEARHVAGCASCAARVDALRAVAGAVAGPVPALDPVRLDSAVAAALSAQNVVPLSAARSARRPAAWLGAAAAVVAVLAVGGLLGQAADDRDDADQMAADSGADTADDTSAGATGAAEESASDEMMTMDDPDAAADAAAGSSLPTTELGELRGVDLQGLVQERQAQRAAEPSPTTVADGGESGGTTSAAPPAAPCEPELRAADPALGAVTFTGEGTWDGELVVVVVFEVGDERRAFVTSYDGCAVRSTASWEV